MVIQVKQEDEVCFLRCAGRFVAGIDPEYLRVKRDEIKQLNCKKVLADFSQVSQVGSVGIGFIVGVYTSTRSLGGRFYARGPEPPRARGIRCHARQHGNPFGCRYLVRASRIV